MSLIRWDPFREFNTLPVRLGSILGKDWELPMSTTAWNPSVDIFENDNEVIIKAELPGMNPKDMEVRLENNVLMLKGERRFEKEAKEENYHRVEREYGSFSRSFTLPMCTGIAGPRWNRSGPEVRHGWRKELNTYKVSPSQWAGLFESISWGL